MTSRRSFLKACGLFLGAVGLGKATWTDSPISRLEPIEVEGISTFVCSKPGGIILLRHDMQIDFYDVRPRRRSVVSHQITDINYETKTVTYRRMW